VSGREKGAPATPAEERAQLRQLTRELHEAAQDARAVLRELQAARAETTEGIKRTINAIVNATADDLNDGFRRASDSLEHFEKVVDEKTAAAVQAIENNHAKLAGFKDSTELARYLVREIYHALAEDPTFARDVGRGMAQASPPQVMVGTRDQLAAFVAAGGDPGYVIDAG
jgi:hypothetical protein